MESKIIEDLILIPEVHYIFRIFVSVSCGFLIGLERSLRLKISGVRTNMLVSIGATTFVLVGSQISPAATAQVTAYCITGVGFLGAGIINREEGDVQGLNSAATLWCVAAVGAQSAAGHYFLAVVVTLAVLMTHFFMRPLGHALAGSRTSARKSRGRHRNSQEVPERTLVKI